MEENNIDKYFKERLHEHAEAPSVDVWERIDAQLVGGKKDLKAAGLQWRSVAILSLGLLLLISGLFYWRMDRLDQENTDLARELTEQRIPAVDPDDVHALESTQALESEHSTPHLEESEVRMGADQRGTSSNSEAELESKSTHSDSSRQASDDLTKKNPQEKAIEGPVGLAVDTQEAHGNTNEEQSDSETGTHTNALSPPDPAMNNNASIIASELTNNSDQTIEDSTRERINSTSLSTAQSENDLGADSEQKIDLNTDELVLIEYIPIQISQFTIGDKEHIITPYTTPYAGIQFLQESKWSVGIAAYQNTTFRRIRTESSEDVQLRRDLDRVEKAVTSIGYRGYLGYRMGERTSLTLGLEYSQWQQEGLYRVSYEPGTVDAEIPFGPTDYSFASELVTSTSTNDVILEATFDPGTEPWVDGFGTASFTNQSVNIERSEQITFLSIPLTFRHQTYLRRLGLQGGVGLAYDLILNSSRETHITGSFEDSRVSNTALQKDGFISAQAEVGLFYRFSERNKISIGPRFKSWLVPLYENDGLRTYPYSNAIEVGVEIGL